MNQIDWPLASTTWDEKEYEALSSVIRDGRFTMGQKVREFEHKFAEYFGSKNAIMVNSGSSANLLAIAALSILNRGKFRPGANIIVPAVSWATTYYPIAQYGYKLKFVDINPETLCMDTHEVEAAIDSDTCAIFAVNLLGQAADLPRLSALAQKNGLILLEDNCESMGATISDKYCGTWGLMGTFSTFFSHHISTMEGGVIVTDDDEIADVLKSIRAHGWTRDLDDKNTLFSKSGKRWDDLFTFMLPGFNVRPLEFEGALGIEQLNKLPELISNRRTNANIFVEAFGGIDGLKLQSGPGISSWFGFSLLLTDSLEGQRDKFVEFLDSLGVESRPIVSGNFTKQPVMKYMNYAIHGTLNAADYLDRNGLFIGNHHFDISTAIEALSSAVQLWQKENN